ncbi:MAG: TetR/AcrR family transcriptional regulator [Candidatus Limnocylindrales bacterium]
MPKLWDTTIETHRQAVRDAALDATTSLVTEHGLRSVTMSQIAEVTGIGRATLYKYFPDVEAVLLAWHERQIASHLRRLEGVRNEPGSPSERLRRVLESYAFIIHERQGRHDTDLAAIMHRDEHVARGQRHLKELVGSVLKDAAATGDVRNDILTDELAAYCLHALAAAGSVKSKAAVRRLVELTLAGLRSPLIAPFAASSRAHIKGV